jgi:hypothetical protein
VKPFISEPERKIIVSVEWTQRWQVYMRLQELDINCSCATNKPLTVEIASVTAAIQLWSVVQQFTASRQDLIRTVERCWCCDA